MVRASQLEKVALSIIMNTRIHVILEILPDSIELEIGFSNI